MSEELIKLLDTTSAAPLIPQDLEPILVETVRKLMPVWSFLKIDRAEAKNHEFNQRTALPSAQFEGENAVTPSSNSSYNRAAVTLKPIRQKGGVTNIAQLSAAKFTDAYETELVGSTKAIAWKIEAATLWGNALADPYMFNGLDPQIVNNLFDVNDKLSLQVLDSMIDQSDDNGGEQHDRVLVMSTKMRSSLIRILRAQFHEEELVYVRGTVEVPAYRGLPVLASTAVRANGTMGTVAATPSVGGFLAASTQYYYVVAPITTDGEQKGSAPAGGLTTVGNKTVGLSWTAYPDAMIYKVYRGTSLTNVGLIDTIAANTYDGSGTVTGTVTTYTDSGTNLSPNASQQPLGLTDSNDQAIFLVDLNAEESFEIRYLSEGQNWLQFMELARTSDKREYFLRSFLAPVLKFENLNAIARRVRPF